MVDPYCVALIETFLKSPCAEDSLKESTIMVPPVNPPDVVVLARVMRDATLKADDPLEYPSIEMAAVIPE